MSRTDEEEDDDVSTRRRRRKTAKKDDSEYVMVALKLQVSQSVRAQAALNTALHTVAVPRQQSQHDAFIVWMRANIEEIEPSSWHDFEQDCMQLVWQYKEQNVSILLLSLIYLFIYLFIV